MNATLPSFLRPYTSQADVILALRELARKREEERKRSEAAKAPTNRYTRN